MSTLVKNKKKQTISPKVVVFWSLICAITLVLVVSLIVLFIQNYKANSKDDIEYLTGNDIFAQEESTYFVLVYEFNTPEENEELERLYKDTFRWRTEINYFVIV